MVGTFQSIALTGASTGSYTISIAAVDVLGRAHVATQLVPVVVDLQAPTSRYTELRNYIATRVLPLIEGHTSAETAGLTDTEVLELFLRDVCSKQRSRTTVSVGTAVFEKEIAQLKN